MHQAAHSSGVLLPSQTLSGSGDPSKPSVERPRKPAMVGAMSTRLVGRAAVPDERPPRWPSGTAASRRAPSRHAGRCRSALACLLGGHPAPAGNAVGVGVGLPRHVDRGDDAALARQSRARPGLADHTSAAHGSRRISSRTPSSAGAAARRGVEQRRRALPRHRHVAGCERRHQAVRRPASPRGSTPSPIVSWP